MTFITLNFENNSFFLIFAATFFDILTKSYHIQRLQQDVLRDAVVNC